MGAIAIVPAAGKAERFGGGKLIADIAGEPLLNHTLRSLLEGAISAIVVVLAPDAAFESVALLNDPRVMQTVNPDPSRGMFSSIHTGLAHAPEGHPILVLPGDMPFVKSATIAAVAAHARESGTIVSPRFSGRRGHPVALPASLRDVILRAPLTATLADILDAPQRGRDYVDVDDAGVLRDVDVRADLIIRDNLLP